VLVLSLFTLSLELKVFAVLASISCPLPLEKGTQWNYEGKVEWTVPSSSKIKSANIRWTSEVVDSFKGSNLQAVVIRGFPDELAWYEPGQTPGFCVLFCVSNRVYRLRADGENGAKSLAWRLSKDPRTLPMNAEELLEWPLAVGRKWGQEPARDDTWYCWCVENAEVKTLSIKGFTGSRSPKVYQLAYRTCPDHQIMEIVPGLGIVRFVYNHHGTVASADVRLVSFNRPGSSRTKRN